MKTLVGHISPETAYVVADYPYGFRLRCQMRYWLEYKKGQGYRLASQTTNPKKPGIVWNKPKHSTYAPLGVMYLDNENHVQWMGLRMYAELAEIDEYCRRFGEALTGEREQAILEYMRAAHRASKRLTWSVTSGEGPRQTEEEQRAIIRAVTLDELKKGEQ